MSNSVPFRKEVNELADKLIEHDDFNMCYKNVTCEITDEENDVAEIFLDGETVCTYVYSGPSFYPTYVDEKLLFEALDVVNS